PMTIGPEPITRMDLRDGSLGMPGRDSIPENRVAGAEIQLVPERVGRRAANIRHGRRSMRRRRPGTPIGIRAFRAVYWTLAVALGLGLLWFVIPGKQHDLAFNEMTTMFYVIGAVAVYRLLLLFARHLGAGEDVEREIRDAEGRVELKLDDRDDGW